MSQMGLSLSKCCSSCKGNNRNSIGVLPEKPLKLLMLGLQGSGKTEIAHMLTTKVKRSNHEPTNGSQYYQTELEIEDGGQGQTTTVGITEIGGSKDMQRIWHHYFASTMAIVYCYDMSSSYENLCETFQLLENVISNAFIRGKSILLIGTKSDLVDEGLQLYDIENTFHLEALALKYACSLRMCHSGYYSKDNGYCSSNSLNDGIKWLIKSVLSSYDKLEERIQSDTNMKKWQDQTQKLIAEGKMKRWRYRRFPKGQTTGGRKYKKVWKYVKSQQESFHIRPHTAPSVYTIPQRSWQTSIDTVDTTISVPNELDDMLKDIAEMET